MRDKDLLTWICPLLLTLMAILTSGCVFYPTKVYVPYAKGATIGTVGQWHDNPPRAQYREDGYTLWVYAPDRGKIELAARVRKGFEPEAILINVDELKIAGPPGPAPSSMEYRTYVSRTAGGVWSSPKPASGLISVDTESIAIDISFNREYKGNIELTIPPILVGAKTFSARSVMFKYESSHVFFELGP